MSSWRPAIVRTARVSLWKVVGSLWRRFFWHYQQYPWRLGLLCEDTVTEDLKREISQEFWDLPARCIDDSFSEKLRSYLDSRERLFDDDIQTFLRT
eukprot:8187803-Pyramimonas_sp.AAC.1